MNHHAAVPSQTRPPCASRLDDLAFMFPGGVSLAFRKRLETAGQRLRLLRALSGRTRAEMARLYGIPAVSLKQAENDGYRLTYKIAWRCSQAYAREGLVVTPEWIQGKNREADQPLLFVGLNVPD